MTGTYVGNSSVATSGTASVSQSVAPRTGFAAGDLMVASWGSNMAVSHTITLPPPFVLAQRGISGAGSTLVTAWGIALGSEAAFVFENSVAIHGAIAIDFYTGSFDSGSLVASGVDNDAGVIDATYPAPDVDAGVNTNTLVCVSYECHSNTAATFDNGFAGLQQSSAASLTTIRRALTASKIQAAGGLTGITTATSGSTLHVGATMVFKEGAADAIPPDAPTGLTATAITE